MMLKYRGRLKVTDWSNYDPDGIEEETFNPTDDQYVEETVMENPHNINFPGFEDPQPNRIVKWYAGRYQLQKDFIMKHFIQLYSQGRIYWPRNFNRRQKNSMTIPTPIANRIAQSIVPRSNSTLYVKTSKLFRKDPVNNRYTKSIGLGLFTSVVIEPNDRIITFKGEIISVEQYHLRTAKGEGGYIVRLSDREYLDCYKSRWENRCLASIANCALHCFDSSTNREARNNAEYRAYHHNDARGWVASLFATRRIQSQTEILWPYGTSYIYPTQLNSSY
jgi:hypothetical protein